MIRVNGGAPPKAEMFGVDYKIIDDDFTLEEKQEIAAAGETALEQKRTEILYRRSCPEGES